ncbi:hypothetical protein [Sulfurospirillum barnesii]|uniref:Uncharacterized protein n=1 Tax=Sulfurospirillum barnesii (strain ATCC 700032 / DSM 10660 / SES-3) TaxID=760154 RepID=I3XXN7_SULBS|nr:hypothetical protein [Sulfurospirillum barnesii]AFL68711.1 hypothetical protein Sulba_1423 [Sulfurospirillum barnesii SES-3]
MSTLSKRERQALNDIFLSLGKNEGFFARMKEKKSEFKHYLKMLFLRHKKNSNHSIRY